MPENIEARRLMRPVSATIPGEGTVREAMQALIELQADPATPNALVVVDADGHYEGVLTARLLFKSLLNLWMPGKAVRQDEALLLEELLSVVEDRARVKVHDALVRGLPTARPGDRLLTLIELSCDKRLEFILVVEDRKPIGLVSVTSIFKAAASLALTPEDEGIRMEGKTFK